MSDLDTDPRAARLCSVVLARLLPRTKRPPTRAEVVSSVAKCLVGASSEADVAHALDGAIAQGLVQAAPLDLTELGRAALRAALGVETLPTPKDWRAVQRSLLLTLALGVKTAKGGDPLAAAILTREYDLPRATSLRGAVDRMCWRALGEDRDAPFDVMRVQRYLLRDLVPEDARVNAATFRRLLAVRAVGAKRSDADSLRKAALLRWARGETAEHEARTANDNAPGASLGDLASAVVSAARAPAVARFHDDRAFIGSIWEHMRGRAPVGSMTLDEFKQQLVAAHRAGLLRMTRADLVGAMNPDEVERSEARYLGATFHFVALDAAGA